MRVNKDKMWLVVYYPMGLALLSLISRTEPLILFSLIVTYYTLDFPFFNYFIYIIIIFILGLPMKIADALLFMILITTLMIYRYRYITKKDLIETIANNPSIFSATLSIAILFALKTISVVAIMLVIIFYILKGDSRYLVGCAIVLLVCSAYLLATSSMKPANDVAILSYYMLTAGVIGSLLEYIMEESKSETT